MSRATTYGVVMTRSGKRKAKDPAVAESALKQDLKVFQKKKGQADKAAEESKQKVETLDAVTDAEKLLKKADKKVNDLDFLLGDRKSDLAIMPGARKEKKEDIADLKNQHVEAKDKQLEASDKHKEAKKARDQLMPSGDETQCKAAERKIREKAIHDRFEAAIAARDVGEQEQKLAALKLDTATKALDARQQDLQDKFAKLVPNGAQKLKDIALAEETVDKMGAEVAKKQKALDAFQAQARGEPQAQALAVRNAARDKLAEAEKAVVDWKGDAAGLKKLEQTRDDRKQTALTAKKQHELYEEVAIGKDTIFKELKRETEDEQKKNKDALKTADGKEMTDLRKRIKENEAELARLDQIQKRAQQINAAGVPKASEEHKEAQTKRDEAREQLIAARAARTKVENAIPVPKKVLERLKDADKEIAKFQKEIKEQEGAISALRDKGANTAADDEKQGINAEIINAQVNLADLKNGLKEREKGLEEFKKLKREEVEKNLGEKEQKELKAARDREANATADFEKAGDAVKQKKQEVDAAVGKATQTASGDLDAAQNRLKAADQNAAKLNDDYEKAVKGNKELEEANAAVAAADKAATTDADAEDKTRAEYAAAAKAAVAAEFLEQGVKEAEQVAAAFAPLKHLSDKDFELALRGEEGSAATVLNLFPEKPKLPDGATKKQQDDFQAALEQYNQKSAEVKENLRHAQETMERLIERDKVLEEADASFEDRKRAFGDMPEALLPPRFREELKAYREVEECFKREEEQERLLKAAKGELKDSILKDLKGLAEVAAPIVELFIDASGIAGNFIPTPKELDAGATKSQKSAFDAAEALKAKFEITSMIAEGIEQFFTAKEFIESEKETLDEVGVKSGDAEKREEQEIRKRIKEDEKAAALLGFMKDFIVTTAKTSSGVLSLTKGGINLAHNTGAADLAKTIGSVTPILGAVLDGIETAEAVYNAGKQIKMAHLESTIHEAAQKGGDEKALVNAYENQANRAANRAVKKSIHAASKGVQTVGSSVTAGGVTAAAGAGTYAAGKGIEYANKGAFKIIDWSQAADAKKTLKLARAGSYQAMTEIFADHQKYATMYIVMKAVEGDTKAMKFCATRGLKENMLDSSTSLALLTKELKIAREEMLKAVDQKDEMNTFDESAAETFEKLARGGKALAKLGDKAVFGAGSKVVDLIKEQVKEMQAKKDDLTPVPEVPNAIKPLNAEGFASLLAHVQTITDKVNNHQQITAKDVQFRANWLKHLQDLIGTLDKDGDWKEEAFKKEGGKTARVRIDEAKAALNALPDTPTA